MQTMFQLIKHVFLQVSVVSNMPPYICIINETEKYMKTKSLLIAVMVMLSAVGATFGVDKPSTVGLAIVPVKGKQVFKIIYKGESTGNVKVSVANSSNTVLYTDTFSNVDGFILPLNFSDVEYGEYTVNVTDATGKRTEKLSYLPQVVSATAIHITKINGENKYLVAVPAQGDQVVNVKIFDQSNNLLHDETKEVSGDFGQIYNTKNISATSGLIFQVTDSTGNTKTVKY